MKTGDEMKNGIMDNVNAVESLIDHLYQLPKAARREFMTRVNALVKADSEPIFDEELMQSIENE